jgi:hypothetical protein
LGGDIVESLVQNAPLSKQRLWGARIVSGVAVLFLLLDGVMHVMVPVPVADAFRQLGFPLKVAPLIGFVELLCTLLYVIPRTTVFGAILLTGVLGGAVTAHVRVGDPLFATLIFPILVGALIWGGPYLRDERLRSLIPLRS